MIKIQLFLFKSLWRLNLSRKSINIFIFGIFLLNCCYGLYSNGARGRMGEMRRFKTWTSSEVNSVMWEYKKAFVWLWKSNSERISLDKRRKQKLTLGKQIIQKRNNSILNKKCSWIEPLDTLALFGFESISQALYDIIYIPSSNSWKRVKGEGNTEGPAGVHKVELIMHCSMVERGNSQGQLYKWSNIRVRNRTWHIGRVPDLTCFWVI